MLVPLARVFREAVRIWRATNSTFPIAAQSAELVCWVSAFLFFRFAANVAPESNMLAFISRCRRTYPESMGHALRLFFDAKFRCQMAWRKTWSSWKNVYSPERSDYQSLLLLLHWILLMVVHLNALFRIEKSVITIAHTKMATTYGSILSSLTCRSLIFVFTILAPFCSFHTSKTQTCRNVENKVIQAT